MTMNQLSYKVMSERSIFVFPDNAAEARAVRRAGGPDVLPVARRRRPKLTQLLSTIIRLPGMAVQPAIAANKTANTITVRGTASVVQILEKIIEQNDKPRAEIVIDVEILEVDRTRSQAVRAQPVGVRARRHLLAGSRRRAAPRTVDQRHDRHDRRRPRGTTTTATGDVDAAVGRAVAAAVQSQHDLARLHTADFYLAVPTAIVRFLESDTQHQARSRSRSCAAPKAPS